MVRFVKAELLTPNWMRAQSLSDLYANFSDRSDHGPWGAYDGWVGMTVAGLAREGDMAGAEEFLRSTTVVTLIGPYGQAHSIRTPLLPYKPFAFTLYNALCGLALAECILTAIFGLQAGAASLLGPSDPSILAPHAPRSVTGALTDIPWQGQLYTAKSSALGVQWEKQ